MFLNNRILPGNITKSLPPPKISLYRYVAKVKNYCSVAPQQQQGSKINDKEKTKSNKTTKSLKLQNSIVYEVPYKYRRGNKATEKLCLIDKSTALEFTKLIFDELSKNMCFVAEANSTFGILTTNLLEAGVPIVHAYENENYFMTYLNSIKEQYPNRLDIRNYNLFRMSKYHYVDKVFNKRHVEDMLVDVPHNVWENEPVMQIIGATTSMTFIKFIITCVIFQYSLATFGRTTFYIALTPSMWNCLTKLDGDRCNNCNSVFFQTLFDYKFLGSIKRQSFLPPPLKSACLEEQSTLHVVKFEPKANIFTDHFTPEEIVAYWYFVKYHVKSKKSRVIPKLERWIPGCGIRLITKNMNIFTRFSDLEPYEIKDLFKEFSSWPEYANSSFFNLHV